MKWSVLAILLLILVSTNVYGKHVEILYVNSNVGSAAGGHVGLKLDNDVFHYQFYPDNRFLLVRESWDYFKLIYNRLRNRTIYAAYCSVTPEAFRQVKNYFLLRLASQKGDFFTYRAAREQKRVLSGLRAGVLNISMPGLGFFDPGSETSPSAIALTDRLSTLLGKNYLAATRVGVADQLSSVLASFDNNLSAEELQRLVICAENLQEKKTAYDIIIQSRGVSATSLVVDSKIVLSAKNRVILGLHLKRRIQVLGRLLASDRMDTGDTLLVEIARCLALAESLERNKLVTLDPYPEKTLETQPDLTDQETLVYLEALFERLTRQRSLLLDSAVSSHGVEADFQYLQIESVNGRRAEIEGALDRNRPIRLSSSMMLPSRSGDVRVMTPVLHEEILGQALGEVESDLSMLKIAHQKKYTYKLIGRNCVNELLRTLNDSFADPEEVTTSLGGWIDPTTDRVVLPHDFFYQASKKYHVTRVDRYPSRRIEIVENMSIREDFFSLWLREGNTISTTTYRYRHGDTPFLFFTDDIIWPRPVLGLSNLLWSAMHGAAGIVTLPADGGDRIHQGIRGMFYSLPELFFFNIRKGTYLYDFINTGGHEL